LDVRTFEDADAEFFFLLQEALQILDSRADEAWVLAIDGDDGSARGSLTERWDEGRRDFGEKFDLVQEWDCHDSGFDTGLCR
jgi:hypothetical protein